MEESSPPFSAEHVAVNPEEAFSLLSHGTITPISQLPISYREAIDKGHSTGWSSLDGVLQGLRPGEVTVITADTGAGKTTFCTQLIVNCAMQQIPVWINSWEMKPETVMRKVASIALRRPMKFQNFTNHDNDQFDQWCKYYRVFINPKTTGTTIEALGNQLMVAKQLGIQIVMLDHLDYLVDGRNKGERVEAIDDTVRRLHELAFSLSMHFLLICHPRQSTGGGEEIGLHSLKGSSSIKQYADNVIVLHRCNRTDNQAAAGKVKLSVVKNRMFGIEGSVYLFYQPQWDGYLEFKDHG